MICPLTSHIGRFQYIMKLDRLILIFSCIGLPEDLSPANTRPTTSNSPLARIATRSSAAPLLKSLIEDAVSEVSLQLFFGNGNFIPDPEKSCFTKMAA